MTLLNAFQYKGPIYQQSLLFKDIIFHQNDSLLLKGALHYVLVRLNAGYT